MSNKINNSYIGERFLDLFPHIEEAGRSALWGCFKRIILTPFQVGRIFFPDHAMGLFGNSCHQISRDSIEKGLPEKLSKNIPKEKFYRGIESIDRLKIEMKMSKEVKLYSGEINLSDSCMGSMHSKTAIPIFLCPKTFLLSDEAIIFIQAHEMSHCINNDQLKECLISITILSLDLAAFFFFTPFAIPLIEGSGSILENYIRRGNEMRADLLAMQTLNSSIGALECLEDSLQINKKAYAEDEHHFKHEPEKYFPVKGMMGCLRKCFHRFFKEVVVSKASPEGESRWDLAHPSLVSRKKAAKNFKNQS